MSDLEVENFRAVLRRLFPDESLLEQYAVLYLTCTSTYNLPTNISYSPVNLLGKPDRYPQYGDFPETYILRRCGKWWKNSEGVQPNYRPQDTDPFESEDFITLGFAHAVIPTDIIIYETFNPGAVVRLWAGLDRDQCPERWTMLWEGAPERAEHAARTFRPPIKPYRDVVNIIRIELNQSLLDYHTAINAVLLVGYKPTSELQQKLLENAIVDNMIFPSYQQTDRSATKPNCDSNSKQDPFQNLPYEVMLHIFQYLDCKSRCRSAQVCRRWSEILVDPALYRELNLKRYWDKINAKSLDYFKKRCKNLRKLDLAWCINVYNLPYISFEQLLAPCRDSLTHVSLNYCGIIPGLLRTSISMSINITDLRLKGAVCIPEDFESLASLKKLTALDVSYTRIFDSTLISILRANPNLRHLNIDMCENISRCNDIALTVAECNRNLVTWSSWKVMSLDAHGVTCLSKCRNLRELDIGWCFLMCDPENCLESIASGCPDLRRLILSSCRSLNDYLLLPVIRSCKHLRQLDLLGIKNISRDICEIILVSLPKLELLEISFCSIGSARQVDMWREQYPDVTIQYNCY